MHPWDQIPHCPMSVAPVAGSSSYTPGICIPKELNRWFDCDSPCSTPDSASPMMGRRFRRMSSRCSSIGVSDLVQSVEVQGDATLCFSEDWSNFKGVIASKDRNHYSIYGKRSTKRKGEILDSPTCKCEASLNNMDGLGPVEEDEETMEIYNIRIKDHDDPMDYNLRRVHCRLGERGCQIDCKNISFQSSDVFIGHKADMIIQKCLGHTLECGSRALVFSGPITLTAQSRLEPRHWDL